jgi:hypothetical protein
MSNPFIDLHNVLGLVTNGYFTYGVTYYWRLQSETGVYTSAWTDIWKFTTKSANHTLFSPTGSLSQSLMNFGTTNQNSGNRKDTIITQNTGSGTFTITGKSIGGSSLLNMRNKNKKENNILFKDEEEIPMATYKNSVLTYDSSFVFIKNNYPVTLAQGEKDTTIIQFQPITYGTHEAQLTITSTDSKAPVHVVHLIGTALGTPEIEVSSGKIDYDTLYSLKSYKTGSIIITNTGNLNMFVYGKYIEGDDRYNYSFLSGGLPSIIPPQGKDTMKINFNSYTTVGKKTAKLYVLSDAENNQLYSIDLTGYIQSPVINATGRIIYGDISIGSKMDSIASITNDGNAPLIINNTYVDGPNGKEFYYSGLNNGMVIQPNQTVTVNAGFKPTETGTRYCRIAILSNDGIKPEASIVLRGNGVQMPTAGGGSNSVLGITGSRVSNYSLSQNYPNPFNPSTSITFGLLKSGYTTLKVYNVLGKEVVKLVEKHLENGEYNITFDAGNLPSGIYYYRLQSGSFNEMKKMILVK